ncbi:hypothetical protein LEP3755_18000 [Leptolyngbya sp. NIES-3755]|nr:hypothetical protein LEP3755_18000 [Leptolyngbya sp. NIES-3755]
MATKAELQAILKDQYGINKNISGELSKESCERLVAVLAQESSVTELVQSYGQKNTSLAQNNAYYGRMKSQAEQKLESLKAEYKKLEDSIATLETAKTTLETKKRQLEQDQERLDLEVKTLASENESLESKVGDLVTRNDELVDANEKLKKDNKDLKNTVDKIRLRLARDVKMLLQYEDNELRKALIRLFRWTLG